MKKKSKKLPDIKKDIKGFLLSEEGKIDKKSLAKIGLSLMILKLMLEPAGAAAVHQSEYGVHTSAWVPSTGHQSTTPHVSHESTHSNGGWC